MESLRRFDADVETLAEEWRSSAVRDLVWVIQGKPGEAGGGAAGYFVRCGILTGFAKPSIAPDPVPTAAQEKIASDLAFDLGLPVPPVLLWDRGSQGDKLFQFCAISLVPFAPANKWQVIHHVAATRDRLLPEFAASAMIAFDTWVGNSDRLNEGNLIASEKAGSNVLQYAYIDHGHTLTHGWADGPAPEPSGPIGPYPAEVKPDARTIAATIAKIEALPDDQIGAVVARIPDGFITSK